MILADKIIKLRKEKGWSQEELALKLNVSRQSVSKWESMASIPDLDKILKLSELFGVSTDYLLKDTIELIEGNSADGNDQYEESIEKARQVSVEEANTYMKLVEQASTRIALGVGMCICSPIFLIVLAGMYEYRVLDITEDMVGGLGGCVLILLIALAVILFVMYGMRLDKYEYLEKENIELDYGIAGIVEKKKNDFEPTYRRNIAIGVGLCVASVVPTLLMAGLGVAESYVVFCAVGALLGIIAVGVFLFIHNGMIWGSYTKLLEEGDYTRAKKLENKKNSNASGIYWCTVTAIYLAASFITNRWDMTWIIWPIAGAFFAAFIGIVRALRNKKEEKEF